MTDQDKVATPLVEPHEKPDTEPREVVVEAPVSTDDGGNEVEWPDLGGKID